MNTAVLLTVHNRKQKTLSALKAIYEQLGLPEDVSISVYLVDDGSSDGTSAAVSSLFPQVKLIQGNGSLYWCGGMHLAFGEALKKGHDYYLWLNDDTTLFPDALAKLLITTKQLGENNLIVGSIQDPDTGQLTYGGVRRLQRWRPLKFFDIPPGDSPLSVETMHGNCVLIPQSVACKVGNLDPAFTHAIGDFDYGLRARKLGFEIHTGPGYFGACRRNPRRDTGLSWSARWKKWMSPLGLPPREWAIFVQRYAGIFWPIFFISFYFRVMVARSDK